MTPKDLKAKRLALIDSTAKRFNNKNRNVKTNVLGDTCVYSPIDKVRIGCAIGIEIEDKDLCRRLDYMSPAPGVNSAQVFNLLPKELQELGQSFLIDIQKLHDKNSYWTDEGLSDEGKCRVQELKEIYGTRDF